MHSHKSNRSAELAANLNGLFDCITRASQLNMEQNILLSAADSSKENETTAQEDFKKTDRVLKEELKRLHEERLAFQRQAQQAQAETRAANAARAEAETQTQLAKQQAAEAQQQVKQALAETHAATEARAEAEEQTQLAKQQAAAAQQQVKQAQAETQEANAARAEAEAKTKAAEQLAQQAQAETQEANAARVKAETKTQLAKQQAAAAQQQVKQAQAETHAATEARAEAKQQTTETKQQLTELQQHVSAQELKIESLKKQLAERSAQKREIDVMPAEKTPATRWFSATLRAASAAGAGAGAGAAIHHTPTAPLPTLEDILNKKATIRWPELHAHSRATKAKAVYDQMRAYIDHRRANTKEYYGISCFHKGYSRTQKLTAAYRCLKIAYGDSDTKLTAADKQALTTPGRSHNGLAKHLRNALDKNDKDTLDSFISTVRSTYQAPEIKI